VGEETKAPRTVLGTAAAAGAAEANRRVLAKGKYLTLVDDRGWEYVTRTGVTGIVVIVAVTDDEKLLLVEQYRPAVRKRVIELPAGLVGDVDAHAGETLHSAAGRELAEETGFAAREMELLAVPGSDEALRFLRAVDVRHVVTADPLPLPIAPRLRGTWPG